MKTEIPDQLSHGRSGEDLLTAKANEILADQRQELYSKTDRMFAVLMVLQWIGAIVAAVIISPRTWIGQRSEVHIHVWAAILIGGAITTLPVMLAIYRPGKPITRYTIAIAQMVMGALLIHLTGGRIETHFHIFGSLAFLAFYRDWTVLVPATIVVAADHLIRGIFYPESVFGSSSPADDLRWLEHAGWVIFEDVFLVIACLRGQAEFRKIARKTADLDEGERRYREVFENASDGIINLNGQTEIIFTNPAASNIFGFTDEEMRQKKISDLLVGDLRLEDGPSIKRYAGSIHSTVAATSVELIAVHKNGQELSIEISFGEYNGDEENKFTAFVRDISERKRLEERVKRSEEYRNLFKHANDAIVVFDPTTQVVLDVNHRACTLFGLDREEFVGMDLKTNSAEPEAHARKVAELVGKGALESFETVRFNKAGRPINLLVNSSLFEFEGELAVLSIKRDITERVRAESSLRSSELRFRGLIENMSEGLVELDNNNKVKFINTAFSDMTGYSSEELLGKDGAQLLDDEHGTSFVEQWKRNRRKGSTDVHEIRLKTKKREPLWSLMGSAPMLDTEGRLVGSMGVHTDITKRKESEERHQHNSLHDALTGLPNRALIMEHMRISLARTARRSDTQFAVLFLDFDRFKMINDSLGHLAGDKLLVMIARRLEKMMRSDDVVARLGGDEYVVLLGNIAAKGDVDSIVSRIQGVFTKSFDLGDQEVYMTTSIGVAVSKPEYTKPEDMLRDADIAMYKAKAAGRSCYFVFSDEMHDQAIQRLQMETDLRLALDNDELVVYYQPIVDIRSQEIVSFEALVRWNSPVRGLVPSNDFIPVAEENGMIDEIGEFVLSEACLQLVAWRNSNAVGPAVSMSVNLSSRQFMNKELGGIISTVLASSGLPPALLWLEVTESHFMKDEEATLETMLLLRKLGLELSIDDFGTGYSNLSYLHRMPISSLKIDRSFVDGLRATGRDNEIVRTIIMMARNLGFSVIAEGIETPQQASELISLGCELGQGFLYSEPLSAEAILNFLESRKLGRPVAFAGLIAGIPAERL